MQLENNRVRLSIADSGEATAPAVVFIHGVTLNSQTYGWLPGEIMRGRRTLRVDLRGHGRSEWMPGGYTLDRYAEDIASIVRERVGHPAVIVGHSLGGCIAWHLAQHCTEVVSAALMEDPPLFLGNRETFDRSGYREVFLAVREAVSAIQAQNSSEDEIVLQLSNMPTPDGSTLSKVTTEDTLRAIACGMLRLDPTVIDAILNCSTLAPVDLSTPVRIPALILAADPGLGAALRAEDIRRLADSHPNVPVVTVNGCGHMIHGSRQHRGLYLEHLNQFLDTHAPANDGTIAQSR